MADVDIASGPALSLAATVAAQPETDGSAPRWTVDRLRAALRWLTPVERMELLAAIEGRAERLQTFEEWIHATRPGYQIYEYSRRTIAVLQDVADGLRSRVFIFMPPQLGKSELVSRLFSAYWLYRFPWDTVALATYGAELSYGLSRDARSNFETSGGEIARDSRSVKWWRTRQGGGMWAAGVGGTAAGRGFGLGIIDDPLKDNEEAASERVRTKRNEWWDSVWYHRQRRGAALIVLMTRWHLKDLAGYLMERERDPVSAEHWYTVSFPAIMPPKRAERTGWGVAGRPAELDDPDRVAPDWRQPGESVCEERKPLVSLLRIKRSLGGDGGYFWNALFQQTPIPPGGGMFKRAEIKRIARHLLPPLSTLWQVRSWDLAATEGGGDWTVGAHMGMGKPDTPFEGRTFVLGMVRGQWGPGNLKLTIRQTIARDGVGIHQRFPQDPAQAGKNFAATIALWLHGYDYGIVPVSGDKTTNAIPVAADCGQGFLYVVDDGDGTADTIVDELAAFGPAADTDDIVDAISGGHAYLSSLARAAGILADPDATRAPSQRAEVAHMLAYIGGHR